MQTETPVTQWHLQQAYPTAVNTEKGNEKEKRKKKKEAIILSHRLHARQLACIQL